VILIDGVNHNRSFALLKAIGYDCAGAVSVHLPKENPEPTITSFPLKGKLLSEIRLNQHIQELPKKPLFLGIEGLCVSLSGAQDKAPICLIENKIAVPIDGCPTTYILKPAIKGFDGIVHNEYFCLKIATRIGLTVPKVEIRWAEDIPYLLIERYDRIVENNKVSRIHQEDFCQALGVVAAKKYQSDGGPSLKSCFDLLRDTSQPIKDRNVLASLVVFNYLIGNMDAHGKNFSLLHYEADTVQISPVYDVLCTNVYDNLAKKMAMKIGGYYESDKIYPRHWQRESKEIGYSYPVIRDIIYKQAESILVSAEIEKKELKEAKLFDPIIDQILQFLEKHISKTLQKFS